MTRCGWPPSVSCAARWRWGCRRCRPPPGRPSTRTRSPPTTPPTPTSWRPAASTTPSPPATPTCASRSSSPSNLVTWTELPSPGALVSEPRWVLPGYEWAPSVAEFDGTWVMYYATYDDPGMGAECVTEATATTVAGPYVNTVGGTGGLRARRRHRPRRLRRRRRRRLPGVDGAPTPIWSAAALANGQSLAPGSQPAAPHRAPAGVGEHRGEPRDGAGRRAVLPVLLGRHMDRPVLRRGLRAVRRPVGALRPAHRPPDPRHHRFGRGARAGRPSSKTGPASGGWPTPRGRPAPSATLRGPLAAHGPLVLRHRGPERDRAPRVVPGPTTTPQPLAQSCPSTDPAPYRLVAADGGVFDFGGADYWRLDRRAGHPRPRRRGGHRPRPPAATGRWAPTGRSTPSTPRSRATWPASRWPARWWGWPPPPQAAATGWWRPTAGCSPSETPPTSARWGASRWPARSWGWPPPPRRRLLAGGGRRRGLRLRRRRLPRLDGRAPPRSTDRGDGGHGRRPRLLAGGLRRRRLLLRRRTLPRLDRRGAAQRPDRGTGPRRTGRLLAGGGRRRGLRLRCGRLRRLRRVPCRSATGRGHGAGRDRGPTGGGGRRRRAGPRARPGLRRRPGGRATSSPRRAGGRPGCGPSSACSCAASSSRWRACFTTDDRAGAALWTPPGSPPTRLLAALAALVPVAPYVAGRHLRAHAARARDDRGHPPHRAALVPGHSRAPTPTVRAAGLARPCSARSWPAATRTGCAPTSSPPRSATCPSTAGTASRSPGRFACPAGRRCGRCGGTPGPPTERRAGVSACGPLPPGADPRAARRGSRSPRRAGR